MIALVRRAHSATFHAKEQETRVNLLLSLASKRDERSRLVEQRSRGRNCECNLALPFEACIRRKTHRAVWLKLQCNSDEWYAYTGHAAETLQPRTKEHRPRKLTADATGVKRYQFFCLANRPPKPPLKTEEKYQTLFVSRSR